MTSISMDKLTNEYVLKAKMLGLHVANRATLDCLNIHCNGIAAFRLYPEDGAILALGPNRRGIHTYLGYHAEVFEAFLIEIDKSKNQPTT